MELSMVPPMMVGLVAMRRMGSAKRRRLTVHASRPGIPSIGNDVPQMTSVLPLRLQRLMALETRLEVIGKWSRELIPILLFQTYYSNHLIQESPGFGCQLSCHVSNKRVNCTRECIVG